MEYITLVIKVISVAAGGKVGGGTFHRKCTEKTKVLRNLEWWRDRTKV